MLDAVRRSLLGLLVGWLLSALFAVGDATHAQVPVGSGDDAVAGAEPTRPLPSPLPLPSPDAAAQAADAHASHVRAARAAVAERRWANAARHFDAAFELDPDDPTLLTARGEAFAAAGERGRAALAFERAIELSEDPIERAERLVRLGRFVEPSDRARARRLFVRALALAPQPPGLVDPLDAVHDAGLDLMSPATLCPALADLWGCAPRSRSGGGIPCRCTIERMSSAPPPDTRDFAKPPVGALLGAALLRLRDERARRVDLAYLVVQTRSGGWQVVDRVEEGWRPGAPYVRRTGRISRFEMLPVGGEAGEGDEARVLVVRSDGERVDGDFEGDGVVRERFGRSWVCQARPAPICVRIPLASTVETLPLRAASTSAPTIGVDYSLDATVAATPEQGAVVELRSASGEAPADVAALVGRWSLDELALFEATWVIPLR